MLSGRCVGLKDMSHVVGERRGKLHPFSCDGMAEAKAVGMQRLAGDVLHVRVVQVVTDEGKTDIFHMDAYLMGAAGLKGE